MKHNFYNLYGVFADKNLNLIGETMKVKITFIEPLLGTTSANPEIAKEFILSKHPDKSPQVDEEASLASGEEEFEKSATVFPREKKKLFMWDYQWKGFFKESCEAMINGDGYTKEQLKKVRLTQYLYKKTIDKQIFVLPRKIFLNLNGGKIEWLQRPLRGQTMRGERICLAHSEMLPAGTTCEIELEWYNKKLGDKIIEWLDMGKRLGTMQWRSGGYGRFTWKEVKV